MPKTPIDPEKVMQNQLELLEKSTAKLKEMLDKPNQFPFEDVRKGLADNARALAQLTLQIRAWRKEGLAKYTNMSKREKTQKAATYISKLPSGYFREAMEIIMADHPSVRMDSKWKNENQSKLMKQTMKSK